jgi:hypothetical protein
LLLVPLLAPELLPLGVEAPPWSLELLPLWLEPAPLVPVPPWLLLLVLVMVLLVPGLVWSLVPP